MLRNVTKSAKLSKNNPENPTLNKEDIELSILDLDKQNN